MNQFPFANKRPINSEGGDRVQQIASNGNPSVDLLFPNTGLSNPTVKELILYPVTVFTCGDLDDLRTKKDRERRQTDKRA